MAATATATTIALGDNGQPLYTCLSCNIAFPNAQDQRGHYRSDWHRYNAKRKLAQLAPIRQDVFQQKVVAASGSSSSSAAAAAAVRQAETQASGSAANGNEMQTDAASSTSSTRNRCDVCSKSFASDKVLADHTNSKKHKETALAASLKQAHALSGKALATNPAKDSASTTADTAASTQPASAPSSSLPLTLNVPENATEEEINALIDAKVASAVRIDPARACLFCTSHASSPPSIETTLEHMARAHGFYLPEREYLIDLSGLMTYLADKITVGNICLFCNARGKSFASLDAVRKHMLDKSHCKIAYTSEQDQMELSDFYDFSSSYPDEEGDEDWEDMDGVEGGDDGSDEDMEDDHEEGAAGLSAPQSSARTDRTKTKKSNEATFGDTEYELVLPSGTRLGHRALRRYYNQTLWTTPATQVQQSFNQRLITAASGGAGGDGGRNSLVIPNRGGKQNAVIARSKGQKKEAMRYMREFRDITRKEREKTRAGFQNNNQKHFRDPLLQ